MDALELVLEFCVANHLQKIELGSLQREVDDYRSKEMRAMRALESLTVGGSEFVGDVDACVAYVKNKVRTLQDVAKNQVVRYNKREEELLKIAEELQKKVAALP